MRSAILHLVSYTQKVGIFYITHLVSRILLNQILDFTRNLTQHVFQLFSPFSELSRLSVTRMAAFLKENTAKDPNVCKVKFSHEALMVHNERGFPVRPFLNEHQIISDGIAELVKSGVYVSNEKVLGGELTVTISHSV